MDPAQAQAQKKQLLKNQYLYDKEMADESGMTMYLSEQQLAAYDTAAPQEQQQATEVRQKLRDMMLVDEQSAEQLKEEYGDVWQEAQDEKQRLQTDASRTGMNKAKNDLMGKKKKAAKAKLKKIDDAKASLERGQIKEKQTRLINMTAGLNSRFYEKRAEIEAQRDAYYESARADRLQRILEAGGTVEDYEKELSTHVNRFDYAEFALTIPITDSMTPEQKEQAEQANRSLKKILNEISREENIMGAKYDAAPGAFMQLSSLDLISERTHAISQNMDRFKQKYPGDTPEKLSRSDVFRDLNRWCSSLGMAQDADPDEMHRAFTHLATVHKINVSKTVEDKGAADTSVAYLERQMDYFMEEADAFMHNVPGLFEKEPSYEELLGHAGEVSEIYKKSQSVQGISKAILQAKAYMETLSPERQAELREKQAKLLTIEHWMTALYHFGKDCDAVVQRGGYPGNGEPVMEQTLDEMRKTMSDQAAKM